MQVYNLWKYRKSYIPYRKYINTRMDLVPKVVLRICNVLSHGNNELNRG